MKIIILIVFAVIALLGCGFIMILIIGAIQEFVQSVRNDTKI